MILFVGDKPSAKMKLGALPFKGAACEKRLVEWIGCLGSRIKYVIINSNPRDSRFFYWVKLALNNNYPIIALGNNASKVMTPTKHFKLPHPSGRNRQINDKQFITNKLSECREYIRRHNESI